MENLFGRTKIFTSYEEINAENIGLVLEEAWITHLFNCSQEDYLFSYVKGKQPILQKEKKVRPEINNKVVENHAKNIVDFLTGYLLEKPIQYVATKESVDDKAMLLLNGNLAMESKDSKDMEIANDMAICGVGVRAVFPNNKYSANSFESPFKFYRLKPQNAFVIYSSNIECEAKVGVVVDTYMDDNGVKRFRLTAYTKEKEFIYEIGVPTSANVKPNPLGEIPIIEYENNPQRLGSFEVVIDMLDAVAKVDSSRVDGVEQFVQALLVFKNVDITKQQLADLLSLGAIKIKDNGEVVANVEYLTQELNQTQTQTLVDHMLATIYEIVGMPVQRSGGGGDNGVAVIYKDGWTKVESKIQKVELSFKNSERKFLKLILIILHTFLPNDFTLKGYDIEIKFTRRNYENIWTKAQTLDLLLKNPHVHPRLAFIYSGISADPEQDYIESEAYYQSVIKANLEKVEDERIEEQ